RQAIGQRFFERFGHLHERDQHVGIVAGTFEEFAEIAETLDARAERLLHIRRKLIHFQSWNLFAHAGCFTGVTSAESSSISRLLRKRSSATQAAATTRSGAAMNTTISFSGNFAANSRPTMIGPTM